MTNFVQSKPTPIDKIALLDYTKLLVNDIIASTRDITRLKNSEFIDDNDLILKSDFVVADVKTKISKKIPIIVRSVVTNEEVNQGSFIVDSNVYSDHNDAIVEIIIEGAYTWQKLNELRFQLQQELYSTLLSVLTDAIEHTHNSSYYLEDVFVDDEDYWNDSSKLTNFTEEIVEEVLARAETFVRSKYKKNITRDQILDYVYAGNLWQKASHFMNERTHAKILKAAYTALVDAGWI